MENAPVHNGENISICVKNETTGKVKKFSNQRKTWRERLGF